MLGQQYHVINGAPKFLEEKFEKIARTSPQQDGDKYSATIFETHIPIYSELHYKRFKSKTHRIEVFTEMQHKSYATRSR